ncbi:4'-phosphopantetheinyl transferase family protein [Kordia jejudonensis]|uniref:4'-phosphopantetheinyl transferase family protein n=1 Tax=Kordia jejudonensis TaxID=1348245 RepID=UPI00069979AB|nr:4'-phosphopantetheinyl transferase superfamily protein [Kordia jejudonensis]
MIALYAEIQEDKHELLLRNNLKLFSKEHQERLLRYRRWQDLQLSLLGKLLIKEGMKSISETTDFKKLRFTKYKKPYFENTPVQFNISHAGQLAIAIIAANYETDIGIDIEKIHPVCVQDFVPQMTTYEQEVVLNAVDKQNAFFNYWTQKEAVIKAHGKGLAIPLTSFEVKNNKAHIDDLTFFLTKMEVKDGYVCHCATQEKINREQFILKEININRFTTT